jgi:chemotaxis protein CheX
MSALQHDELILMVRTATESVFEMMLGEGVTAESAYVDNIAAASSSNGVVSFIGLAGAWMGTGSISCSASCACKIASHLLMGEYPAVDDEVLDAVAEVTNMILGNVKTSLEERLGPMGLSIPTVIYGRNFSSRSVGSQEWSIVPFNWCGERIEVQLCLAERRSAIKARLPVASLPVAAQV